MPTGNTVKVQRGEITSLREFALECARGFGALYQLRDDASAEIPDEIEADTSYHDKAIERESANVSRLVAMTAEEAAAAEAKEYEAMVEAFSARELERSLSEVRYKRMLENVNEWVPPTDEHVKLKEFMQERLTSSIEFDCGAGAYPKRMGPKEWLKRSIETAERNFEYHVRGRARAITRAREATEWLKALRDSLS